MAEPSQLGKYQLLDRIGAGGMAEIHLARVQGAAGFEKLVVVKKLLPALAEESDYVAQFIDEARLAAGFSHANIVTTFDFGETGGAYFIAMEYVQGKNLRRIQDVLTHRGKRLPEAAAVHITAEICRGLDYAHNRTDATGRRLGIVHRDVSPQNVVISYGGDVKLLDFGIAKSVSREFQTAAGIVKGKLRYMAPEQTTGEPIDARADQFAIAVMLWEMVHGKRPMPDLPETQMVKWVQLGEFPAPPGSESGSSGLDAILNKALAVIPDNRYPSCGELARALTLHNTVRWPAFSPSDLSRLLEDEFQEDVRRERSWIAAMLEAQSAKVAVSMVPDSMRVPDAASRDDIATSLVTDSKKGAEGTLSRGGASLPLVKGNLPAPRRGTRWLPFAAVGLAAGLAVWGVPKLVEHAAPAPTPATVIAAATATPSASAPLPTPTLAPATPAAAPSPSPRPTKLAVATPVPTQRRVPVPTATAAVPMATVSVNVSEGWAEVWIDGVLVKKDTPLLKYSLPAGKHEVTVIRSGRKRTQSVVLSPGVHRVVTLDAP